MKLQTLEEALKLIPEYILLPEGTKFTKHSMELVDTINGPMWIAANNYYDRRVEKYKSVREPIPKEVRAAMARNLLTANAAQDVSVLWPFGTWLLKCTE